MTDLKYYLVLFKMEGHTTWHGTFYSSLEIAMNRLKEIKNITAKKFFEIDRITGTMEEF